MPAPSGLSVGKSLARERMEEKAEQVKQRIVTDFNRISIEDRLEKMNTRQKPGTPLVREYISRDF